MRARELGTSPMDILYSSKPHVSVKYRVENPCNGLGEVSLPAGVLWTCLMHHQIHAHLERIRLAEPAGSRHDVNI